MVLGGPNGGPVPSRGYSQVLFPGHLEATVYILVCTGCDQEPWGAGHATVMVRSHGGQVMQR